MLRFTLCCAAALCGMLSLSAVRAEDNAGFTPLFNGKDLTGWHGDAKLWSVQDGEIVGVTDGKIPDNQFLVSDKEYSNFVLKVKFKLHDHKGNSGIQYRSEELKDKPFVVKGNQADIADNQFMGILYGEKSRGMIKTVSDEIKPELDKAVKKNDWNEYVITADGAHLVQQINGVTTVDIQDKDGPTNGIIALQLHAGHNMKISFKEIMLKPLGK